MSDGPKQNTDREIWRETPDDYYAPSIHVTQGGSIGVNVGGHVIVAGVREWHAAAKVMIGAEQRPQPMQQTPDAVPGLPQTLPPPTESERETIAAWLTVFAEQLDDGIFLFDDWTRAKLNAAAAILAARPCRVDAGVTDEALARVICREDGIDPDMLILDANDDVNTCEAWRNYLDHAKAARALLSTTQGGKNV